MIISNKLFLSNELSCEEKIALGFILKGNRRYKFISRETLAKVINTSPQQASNVLRKLHEKGLIMWIKVERKQYKIIIVCQKAFNDFAEISGEEKINEACILNDNYIHLLGEAEAKKPLNITIDKNREKLEKIAARLYGKK